MATTTRWGAVLGGAAAAWAVAAAALPPSASSGPAGAGRTAAPEVAPSAAPERLEDTGLWADPGTRTLAPGVLPFTPQYPLWSDGATKRRWIRLPPGAAIDASDPDAWVFPVGTKLWKEFSFGRRVETRYLERAEAGRWIYAAYLWSEDGSSARLAPAHGVRGVAPVAPGVSHDIPGTQDCKACHEARGTPVLGFTALQLSPERDPGAPHAERPEPGAVDLAALVDRGLVRGLPASGRRPRIAARSPRERAALGYLAANCGTCHSARGELAGLGLALDVPLGVEPPALATTRGESRFQPDDGGHLPRVAPGDPARSVLVRRVASASPLDRMPPLGSKVVDAEAVRLLEGWIREDLGPRTARRR